MATIITFPIRGALTVPDGTGEMFFEKLTGITGSTTSLWEHLVGSYNDSTQQEGFGSAFRIPSNYLGSTSDAFVLDWAANATTGVAEFQVDYRAVADNEDLSSTTAQESKSTTATASTVANPRRELVVSISTGNVAADDVVQYNFYRNAQSTADTLGVKLWDAGLNFRCQVST